jgi:ribosomal protein S18 acetylase RimI-like enzyme
LPLPWYPRRGLARSEEVQYVAQSSMTVPLAAPIIRRATAEDAARIGVIHAEGWRWAYRGRLPDDYLDTIDIDRRIAWWVRHLAADPPIVVFVAENADDRHPDHILGFCHVGSARLETEPRTGELHSMYMLESAAGHGVGGALARAGMSALRAEGFDRAVLWVLATNAEARRFYEHLGWSEDGTRHTFTLRADVHAPAVRYRIDL